MALTDTWMAVTAWKGLSESFTTCGQTLEEIAVVFASNQKEAVKEVSGKRCWF